MVFHSTLILHLFSVFSLVSSGFTPDFSQWLEKYYGKPIKDQLERKDLGAGGCFGGRASAEERTKNQPVVFVHGVSDTAGEKMLQAAKYFMTKGYSQSELYSTTYFNGAQGNPVKWVEYSMRCEYVKQQPEAVCMKQGCGSCRIHVLGQNRDILANGEAEFVWEQPCYETPMK